MSSKVDSKAKSRFNMTTSNPKYINYTKGMVSSTKHLIIKVFSFIVIIGICYVILAPVIGMVVNSFMSDTDAYNPMVYMIPQNSTLERYRLAWERLNYIPTISRDLLYSGSLMLIQVFVCSMVGYGFARFNFPFKKLLFACVVVMIVIPDHTIMLPIYMTFRNFDPLGLVSLIAGKPINLMSTPVPMYIMTIFGCGVRSGLYIYIFNQFSEAYQKKLKRQP